MAQNTTLSKEALLIIDIQEFYFIDGKSQLVNPEAASEKAALLLEHFRNNNKLIVHVRHASTKNASIHKNVQPKDDEKVITKNYVNSYRETDLQEFLQQHNITNVVICGMMTHVCVEAAARASADFGFKVTVISDACATRTVRYDAKTVQSDDVHRSTLATIKDYYGSVTTSDEYLKEAD
jgi:nicotinamidase-related amidase